MDMNVLVINGSPRKEGCTHTALMEVASVLNKEVFLLLNFTSVLKRFAPVLLVEHVPRQGIVHLMRIGSMRQ